MKKLRMAVILPFLFFLFTFILQSDRVYAATFEGFKASCLDAKVKGDRDPDWHTAILTVPAPAEDRLSPQADTKTWVFVCIATDAGQKCTSGSEAIDNEVFKSTADLAYIKNIDDFKKMTGVSKGTNPTKTNTDTAKPQFIETIEWYDVFKPKTFTHTWFWVQPITALPDDGGGAAGDQGAQQQATFDFLAKEVKDVAKCIKIAWDPKGYVFDAKTLYPVKGIAVEISKKNAANIYEVMPSGLGLTNPDTSHDQNGQYNFYTPDGSYKLRVVSSNASIANISTLSAQEQAKISSLFTLSDPAESTMYQEGSEIVESGGKMAISHLPVILTDPNPAVNDARLIKNLTILGREETPSNQGGVLLLGEVSHPKSLIRLLVTYVDQDQKTYLDTRSELANEVGDYRINIPQQKYINGVEVYMVGYEVSFALNPAFYPDAPPQAKLPGKMSTLSRIIESIRSFIMGNVFAAGTTTSFSGQPIPTYLEGVAYDAKGVAIPKAVVGIYPTFSNNPMYLTVADETGKYKIGSQNIPQFQYTLRYKKATGEVIQVDTKTFIKQNAKYFASTGVKPFAQKTTTLAEDKAVQEYFANTNTKEDLRLPSTAQKGGGSANNRSGTSGSSSSSRDQVNPITAPGGLMGGAGMQGVLMIVVVIMVLIMIGVGAFIMMKSRQQTPPQF